MQIESELVFKNNESLKFTTQEISQNQTIASNSRRYCQDISAQHLNQNIVINLLQKLQNQQIVVQAYEERIQNLSKLDFYCRYTYLDKPEDNEIQFNQSFSQSFLDSESERVNSKFSKEELLDELDLRMQFFALNDQESQTKNYIQMNIKLDLARLCQMYLGAQDMLKKSLPTECIEIKKYEKRVKQVREKVKDKKYRFSEESQISIRTSSFRNEQSQSVTSSNNSSKKGFISNISNRMIQAKSKSEISTSIKSSFLKQHNSEHSMQNDDNQDIFIEEQCQPLLKLNDNMLIEEELKESWQDLIKELKVNPKVTSGVIKQLMQQGFDQQTSTYDQTHKNLLFNISHLFFDNVYQNQRLAFQESNQFLKFLIQFGMDNISQVDFMLDNRTGNTCIKNDVLKKTLMCLFEGVTRKIPGINYLQFIFQGNINLINFHQIKKDLKALSKETDYLTNQQSRKSKMQQLQKVNSLDQVVQEQEDEKPSFVKKLKMFFKRNNSLRESREEVKLFEESKANIKKSVRQTSKNENNEDIKTFESMCFVYGGKTDPIKNKFEQEPNQEDGKKIPTRIELIEKLIELERVNKFEFAMDEFQQFQPQKQDKVIISSQFLKQQGLKKIESKRLTSENQKYSNPKDLTYHIKILLAKNLDKILFSHNKTPFEIRAFLKILILRSQDISNINTKVKVDTNDIRMLAEFMIAGWLNSGYRSPRSFGLQPSIDKELELEFIFFQACRITFEHLMMMQKIPEEFVEWIDVEELNKFIEDQASKVKVYWDQLLNVDLSEIETNLKPQVIDTCIIKIDDLELIHFYCTQATKNEQNNGQQWKVLNSILNQLSKWVVYENTEDFNLSQVTPLIRQNMHDQTISRHLSQLFGLSEMTREECDPFEYYILFILQKSEQSLEIEIDDWKNDQQNEIKTLNLEFVKENYPNLLNEDIKLRQDQRLTDKFVRISQLPQQQIDTAEEDLMKINQLLSKNDFEISANNYMNKRKNNLSKEEASFKIYHIFKLIMALLKNSNFTLNQFRNQSRKQNDSLIENKGLAKILELLIHKDNVSSQDSFQIKTICFQIMHQLRKLNLQSNLESQICLLKHYQSIMTKWIKFSRDYLNSIVLKTEQFTIDVELFEVGITNLKQFSNRFKNIINFSKIISKQSPEVCIMECFNVNLDSQLKKGILLNFKCSEHSNEIPVSCFMLFGGVSRKQDQLALLKSEEDEKTVLMTMDQKTLRDVVEKRRKTFLQAYSNHIEITKHNQTCKDMIEKIKDRKIVDIEKFVKKFTVDFRDPYLKSLIRSDQDKKNFYLQLLKEEQKSKQTQDGGEINSLLMMEPFDYMGIVKSYGMFLQHFSIITSTSLNYSYVDEISDKDNFIKKHYDFLIYDLQAKALRYNIHEYIIKRIHKALFESRQQSELDIKVQNLVLAKDGHPKWVLTSQQSKDKVKMGQRVEDFTETSEWCDLALYDTSVRILMKLTDADTPHAKAQIIEQAVNSAMNSMKIAAPYKSSSTYGEDLRQHLMRFLILQMFKMHQKLKQPLKLFSHLLFVLLFNVPQNEEVMHSVLKRLKQKSKDEEQTNFTETPYLKQQELIHSEMGTRYKAYEWFVLLRNLINEDEQKN